MSHFKFTLPGNHIPLLHAGCPGASGPRGPTSICQFTFYQHNPQPAALPAAHLSRDPEGRTLTPANCICRKINLRCAQLATMRGRVRAKCLPGERSRAGCPAGRETDDSTVGRSTLPLRADSVHSAPGAHPPAARQSP